MTRAALRPRASAAWHHLPVPTSAPLSPELSPERPAGPAPSSTWQIWFDGCALPNPGRIGLGALLVSPQGNRIELSSPAGRSGCSNEAELIALCAALEHAAGLGARHIYIRGDSDFVVRHLRGEQRTAIAPLLELVVRTEALLARFESVSLEWVPRHRNRDADRLSRAALGLPDKPAPVPGRRR
ncbi:ribonuclease HI family protein [Methyloversatilis sp. XJ19-13]|uniref:ribonuclease HI family protein n=1 Tax=Methyloversatilis sp. XJ19-13 TaxID=2963430 RepID=UPI00211CC051|nr:ribonuclease HI family protein [Methyloversatilis sp. XJ19-13]MCQ9374544.1 ribonuclease HI family protein [Methyloversatilis sp. XJ19-13]